METIILALMILIMSGVFLALIINSYHTFRLKSNYLRPMVKAALQYGLQNSFDFFSEKISVKADAFITAFTEKFTELSRAKLPRAMIEQAEVLQQPDQQLLISVKTPGLFLQDVKYSYATVTGSKTVWSITSELGMLDYYLHEKAAARKRKLEQDKEIYLKIKTEVEKLLEDLPIYHNHGIRLHNWDEILTTLYHRGEDELYSLVKTNYELLVSYESTVA